MVQELVQVIADILPFLSIAPFLARDQCCYAAASNATSSTEMGLSLNIIGTGEGRTELAKTLADHLDFSTPRRGFNILASSEAQISYDRRSNVKV